MPTSAFRVGSASKTPGPETNCCGPIYVRKGSQQGRLPPGHVPPYVSRRQVSLRAYDADDSIIAAEVVEGSEVASHLTSLFANREVRYVHLHNAWRGCFSCTALPA